VRATLGELLRAHRLRRGLSQEALAGLVEPALSVNTIGNLERGRTRPYGHTVAALADALGLDAAERAELLAAWSAGASAEADRDPPADSPPAAEAPGRPAGGRNLPAPLTSFVGREEELARVRALLASNRLLTVTGTGGSGKTRLALRAAADALPCYRDGVWLVELAPLTQPELVPQAVASALGLREQPERPPLATLVEALASRQLLLVIDNCEHLVDACARVVDAILRGCPEVAFLATSREPLNVAGETTWRVPSLGFADPLALPPVGQLTRYDAVRLFVDRACAVLPGFALGDDNAPAVAEICHRLDGMPLAIELAAARVRMLPPREIAARLNDRFRLLTGGSRTALPRQQTLRALVDWSYDLLSPPEQVLLHRLSVFAGGWTLEAAEAACGVAPLRRHDVLDLLTALVDKSLALADDGGREGRYRMLETLRQYGLEKLGGEADAARERHARYYLHLGEAALGEWLRTRRRSPLTRLHDDLDNLRASALTLVERGDVEAAGRLGLVLATVADQFRHLREGREQIAAVLAMDGWAEHPALHARLLYRAADFAFIQADYAAARRFQTERLAAHELTGDRAEAAHALNWLGVIARDEGRLEEAREQLERSMAIYQELGDDHGLAMSLDRLGTVAHAIGDVDAAHRFYERGVALWRAADDWDAAVASRPWSGFYLAWTLLNQALLALDTGDLPNARAAAREAIVLRRQADDQPGMLYDVLMQACLAAGAAASEPTDESRRAHAARALRLAGQVEAYCEATTTRLMPFYCDHLTRWVARAKALLGVEAATVAGTLERPASIEHLLDEALAEP